MDTDVEARIRCAVSAGEFDKASALWETYASQVEESIRSGAFSVEDMAHLGELIEWTRGTVICNRAHAQRRVCNQITKLHAAAVYGRLLV